MFWKWDNFILKDLVAISVYTCTVYFPKTYKQLISDNPKCS